jgi:hypothetical protein
MSARHTHERVEESRAAMSEPDEVVRQYRAALLAEAELDRRDLDEIEDHLRSLAEELQTTGLSQADAIREACRRLGKPHALAREHARVRSPFGARLSRARAWSAAALLAPWWWSFAKLTLVEVRGMAPGITSIFGINLVIASAVMLGLLARMSWARAILVGALSWLMVDRAIGWVGDGPPHDPREVARIACMAGAFLFVVPWRRRELAAPGYAIALLAWTYHGANVVSSFQLGSPDQLPVTDLVGGVAFFATLAAGLGVLVRARWAAVASLAASVSLVIAYTELRTRTFHTATPRLSAILWLGAVLVGAAAAATAAFLAWRSARTSLGTIRHVIDAPFA